MSNTTPRGKPRGNPKRMNTFEAPKRTGSAPPAPHYGAYFNPMMAQQQYMGGRGMPRAVPRGRPVQKGGHRGQPQMPPRGQIPPRGQMPPRGQPGTFIPAMHQYYHPVMYQQMAGYPGSGPRKKIEVVRPKKRRGLAIVSSSTGEVIKSDRKKEEPKKEEDEEKKQDDKAVDEEKKRKQKEEEEKKRKQEEEEEKKRKQEEEEKAAKLVAEKELAELLERQRKEEELKKEKEKLQKEREQEEELQRKKKKEEELQRKKKEEEEGEKKAAVETVKKIKEPVVAPTTTTTTTSTKDKVVEEKKAPTRSFSFRPGGGLKLRPVSKTQTVTTQKTKSSSGPKIVFGKEALIKLKEASKDLNPSWLIGKIIKIEPFELSSGSGRFGGGKYSSGNNNNNNNIKSDYRRGAMNNNTRFPSSSSGGRNNNSYNSNIRNSPYSSSGSGGYQQQRRNDRSSSSQQQKSWTRGVKQPEPPKQKNNNRKQNNRRNKHSYDSAPLDGYEPKKTENAWSRDKIKTNDQNEIVLRKCRNQLNKLTPEKFQKISDNILEISIDNRVVFKGLIYAIFDMALIQPVYSSMYAQLCAQVYKKSDSVFISRITKVRKNSSGKWEYDVGDPECKSPEFSSEDEARKAGQKAASFKRILLAKCQMEFQKQIDWDEFAKAYDWEKLNELETERAKAEVEYKTNIAKKRMLGNIKFIGELFIKKMLSGKIMFHCITKMLFVNGKSEDRTPVSPEYIESVCKLFAVIGKQLEENNKYKSMVDLYFERLKELKTKKMETRIKFMIDDLFELRARKWKPRRDEKAPATIAQVRQQAAQEELAKSKRSNSYARGQHSRGSGGSSSGANGNRSRHQRGGFNMPTVFSSTTTSMSQDARRRQGSSSSSTSQSGRNQPRNSRINNTGSKLNLQPQRGVRKPRKETTTQRREGDDSKKSTKPMGLEDYKKRCKSTVNEYLHSLDKKEVKVCLAEYAQSDNSPFVVQCLNTVIECSPSKAKKLIADLATLYSFLLKENSLRNGDLEKGFKSVLGMDCLDDIAIDVPQMPKFLGSFFAALIKNGVTDLNTPMKEFHSTSLKSGMAEKILKYTLLDMKVGGTADLIAKHLKMANLNSLLNDKSMKTFLESNEMKDVADLL